jgi:hypothetical protein
MFDGEDAVRFGRLWDSLEFEEDEPEWVPELHASPEYTLNVYYPPLYWRKKDEDRWRANLRHGSWTERGVVFY